MLDKWEAMILKSCPTSWDVGVGKIMLKSNTNYPTVGNSGSPTVKLIL